MIKLPNGFEVTYFEKLQDYYIAIVTRNGNEIELTANTLQALINDIQRLAGERKAARKDCILPVSLIDFCQGVGSNKVIIDNILLYNSVASMCRTNGFKLKRKKLRLHLGKYLLTREIA